MSNERNRVLTAEELAEAAALCQAPPSEQLVIGIEQFNRGDYYECHETLEVLWLGEARPIRRFYQGILHIAVGLHHLRRGNRKGGTSKLRSGIGYLVSFVPVCHEVNVTDLVSRARLCLEFVENSIAVEGEFDWPQAPRIEIRRKRGGDADAPAALTHLPDEVSQASFPTRG